MEIQPTVSGTPYHVPVLEKQDVNLKLAQD